MGDLPYADKPWFKGEGRPRVEPLKPNQLEFIEWLVNPARQGSQAEWARTHGVSPKTVIDWKKTKAFREAWDNRLKDLNVDPQRIQDVIEAIHRAAVGGDVKAAQLYLQYIDRFTPKQVQVIEDRSVRELSDDELADQLTQSAQALRAV